MYRKAVYAGVAFLFLLGLAVNSRPTAAQGPGIGLAQLASGLVAPVDLDSPPGDARTFIVDQVGIIYIVDETGTMLPDPFLNIQDRMVQLDPNYDERGLLGLAFHPDFVNNGRFYVFYSAPLRAEAPADWNCTNHLSEFMVSADNPNMADPNTERVLLMVDKPQMNHNGGDIAFGPDGFLYIPLGDGGGANDTDIGHTEGLGNGQDITNVLGSILRIDVNGGDPYGIPQDNPFAGSADVPNETFAYGFRNPWRISFDDQGRLFVADAGQDLYEEVSIVQAGGNYGWNIKEATHCFDPANPETPPADCATTGAGGEALVDPVIEFGHDQGLVVVGGDTYTGSVADLAGLYIFSNWSAGEGPAGSLFAAAPADGGLWVFNPLTIANNADGGLHLFVLAIEKGGDGETYVLTSGMAGPSGNTGAVWRIVPVDQAGPPTGAPADSGEDGESAAETAETTVDVSLVEFAIEMPNSIPAGTVTFNVTNNGTVEHNFEIEGTGLEQVFEMNLQPGETQTMTVDLPAGTYEVYCPVGDHHDQGMELELTVTESGEAAAEEGEDTEAPADTSEDSGGGTDSLY